MRYKLTIAYRGTHYFGWQSQTRPATWKGPAVGDDQGIPTVQRALKIAIGGVVGHPIVLQGSSRTDARVHAKGQVAHFDTDQVQIPPEGLRRAVNARLPSDILIRSIEPVDDAFEASRATVRKRYQYLIWHDDDRPVFAADLAWHRWQDLDIAAMKHAAGDFVGTHDFTSFARPGHGRLTATRTIHHCAISYRKPSLIIGVEGTGFLWNQIRIMVGTLVHIGLGRYPADAIPQMLAARDRKAAGGTAPPRGLYLQWIRY